MCFTKWISDLALQLNKAKKNKKNNTSIYFMSEIHYILCTNFTTYQYLNSMMQIYTLIIIFFS